MTTRSTAKKILQSFHARTTLWGIFEIRAKEMECTIDYLINEAMRHYATTNGFLGDDDPPEPQSRGFDEAQTLSGGPAQPTAPMKATVQSRPGPAGLPRPGGRPTATGKPPSLPRPGSASVPKPPPAKPPSPTTGAGTNPGESEAAHLPKLTLIYQGAKISVSQEQFIIGRGSKSSDLPIKDSNVSRKHAAIIYHNGAFYLKDLGSTNGIEFGGKQIDSKRIDEGDVFTVCGHEVHFTYQV